SNRPRRPLLRPSRCLHPRVVTLQDQPRFVAKISCFLIVGYATIYYLHLRKERQWIRNPEVSRSSELVKPRTQGICPRRCRRCSSTRSSWRAKTPGSRPPNLTAS